MADAGTVLEAEDILYVTGDFENVKRFVEDYLLAMLDTSILPKKHKTQPIHWIFMR